MERREQAAAQALAAADERERRAEERLRAAIRQTALLRLGTAGDGLADAERLLDVPDDVGDQAVAAAAAAELKDPADAAPLRLTSRSASKRSDGAFYLSAAAGTNELGVVNVRGIARPPSGFTGGRIGILPDNGCRPKAPEVLRCARWSVTPA
ncbi:hypothetical protein [Kitasatospora kifunensis]|uniref:Uncharacterized protein n=1 Tax=Kitasatospora kifunensis TaxID=58351 RepID=A0A7W7R8L8_KITKI|nr:hypothetical protein [Kitasatospora kifunensis]MBB4927304.1 hypothetical protein [Kitasatospora kifunensis]